MRVKTFVLFFFLFSIEVFAKLGDSSASEASPAIRDMYEPSRLYFPVIIPVFILSLVLLYSLCKRHCIVPSPKKHLILPTISGICMFMVFPAIYAKFFQIFVELGVTSNFPRIDYPFLASGGIIYGISLIAIWLMFQPIVLQVALRRKDKPLPYTPFILFSLGYASWFIWTLLTPLICIM